MFALESAHRGDSNVYTQYTIFIIKKIITPDYSKSAAMGFSQDLKNEFESSYMLGVNLSFKEGRIYFVPFVLFLMDDPVSKHCRL